MNVIYESKRLAPKLRSNLSITILYLYYLLASHAVCSAELSKDSSVLEGASSKTDSSGNVKLNSFDFTNDEDVLNNFGIIEDTDFSKEVALSRSDKALLPAGFVNKIILTSSVDYDSNPALVDSRKNPVWIYTLSPQLLLDYTGEFNRLYLDSALVLQRPSNDAVLPDREDPRLTIGWDRTYESGNFGVFVNYSQLLSRAQEIRTTGTFVANVDSESTQRTRTFGAKLEHNFAQRWNSSTYVDLRKDSFSGGINLIGATTLDVKSSLNYEYSERLNTFIQLGYIEIRPDKIFDDTKLVRLALGADYLFSDSLRGTFKVSDNKISGTESNNEWAAGTKFTYEFDRVELSTELNREVAAAGGGASFQKTDTLAITWAYNLSEKDSLGAAYSIVKFHEDSQAGLPGQKFRQLSATYNRLLTSKWNARTNLSYRELVPEAGGSSVEGALLGVSLTYNGLSF